MYMNSQMVLLAKDLELLSVEAPGSIIPLVIRINSLIDKRASQCLKKINFISYEIATQCKNTTEQDRLHILNDYFFNKQHFQISEKTHYELYNIHNVITQRQGTPLSIALIYLHFATHIHLPLYLIQLQGFRMIKWICGNKQSKYINLANRGKLLDESQILEILSQSIGNANKNEGKMKNPNLINTQLEIIPTRNLLLYYVKSLLEIYKNEKKEREHKIMLDVSLMISPSNLNLLSQRALLLKKMGHHKAALSDLKKYFSFTNIEDSPEEIRLAFYELKSTDSYSSQANWMH